MCLLYENLAPTTFAIGFLNCSFVRVRDAFIDWKKQQFGRIESKEIRLALDIALKELQPLTSIPRKWLLVPTGSNWVAYFDNCIRGPDPVPVVSYLAQQLACRGAVAISVPQTLFQKVPTARGLYGAVQFQLFAACQTQFLNYERTVSVTNDGGKWRFDANGSVQSFEDTCSYRRRRLVDRFTPEMLKKYCRALDIRVDSVDFYRSPGVLVWTSDRPPSGHLALPLAEVRQQIGLGR